MAKILKCVRASSIFNVDLPDSVEMFFPDDSLYTSFFSALYFRDIPFSVDMTFTDIGVVLKFYKSSEAE